MSTSKNNEERILENLNSDFAKIKSELSVLHVSVRGLTNAIREESGDVAVITKLAVLDQKIDSINKWMENNSSTTNKLSGDISSIKDELDDLGAKILLLDRMVQDHDDKIIEEQRVSHTSIQNELELMREEKLAKIKVKEEHKKQIVRLLFAIVAGVVSFIVGHYFK